MFTRREVLRLLGGVGAIGAFSADDLLALGVRTHAGLAISPLGLGFFDIHQLHTVAAACDRIIPVTDTPGALAAECHRFAERIVQDHYGAARQTQFLAGLVDLDRRASRLKQRLFVDLIESDRDTVLKATEADALAATDRTNSFWRDLKYLTIYGYYTSRIGIEQELQTNFYPGYYDGCVAISGGAG